MSDLIPEAILRRIEEYWTLRKTGQIALNFFEGTILTADVRETVKVAMKKGLDKSEVKP